MTNDAPFLFFKNLLFTVPFFLLSIRNLPFPRPLFFFAFCCFLYNLLSFVPGLKVPSLACVSFRRETNNKKKEEKTLLCWSVSLFGLRLAGQTQMAAASRPRRRWGTRFPHDTSPGRVPFIPHSLAPVPRVRTLERRSFLFARLVFDFEPRPLP